MERSRRHFTLFLSLFLIGVMTLSVMNSQSQVVNPSDFSWTELSPTNLPPGRDSHVIVYDHLADKVVMFGGWADSSPVTYVNDTWVFDPITQDWTNITSMTSGNPGARGYISGVYDQSTAEVIFFGGTNETRGFNDTWAFNYNGYTWRNITTSVSPSERNWYGLAYSTEDSTAVMFGGYDYAGSRYYNDTWTFKSDSGWTNVTSLATTPSGRTGTKLVYDQRNDKFIMFGGQNSTGYNLNDTWVYNLNSNVWTQMSPATAPGNRTAHTMMYDPYHSQVVLFGGYDVNNNLNDTWVYDYPTNTWTNVTQPNAPSVRSYLRSTYMASTNEHLMFGGYDDYSLNDTWVLKWAGGTPPVTSNTATSSTDTSSTSSSTTSVNTDTSTSSSKTTSSPLPFLGYSVIFTGMIAIFLLRKNKN